MSPQDRYAGFEAPDRDERPGLHVVDSETPSDPNDKNANDPKKPKLTFQNLRDVRHDVRNREPRKWIVEGLIAETQYGVLSKVDKGQKTWDAMDLAVSIVTGTPWLGIFPVLVTGPVVVFAGEGDDDEYIARFDAVCASKGVAPNETAENVTICFRVPTLSNEQVMDEVQAHLDEHEPTMVILDPLYLAVGGASGSDLYAMGEVLSKLQYAVQAVKAALVVLTHHKKGDSSDPFGKITGVGPGAWGRFLIVGDITDRHEDPDHPGGSVVTTRMEFRGGRIADKDVTYRRRIWSDDPADLSAPLHYTMERLESAAIPAELAGLRPAHRRVLDALRADPGSWLDAKVIGDLLAKDSSGGGPLKKRTIQDAGKVLVEEGWADRRQAGKYNSWEWTALAERGPKRDLSSEPELAKDLF